MLVIMANVIIIHVLLPESLHTKIYVYICKTCYLLLQLIAIFVLLYLDNVVHLV